MKFLTKSSDYAIRALVTLAGDRDNFVSARKISKKQSIPYQFLRRILRELIHNKFVVSREGGRGGFKITADPDKVGIADVVRIFQGDVQFAECVFSKKVCRNSSECVLRKEIKRVGEVVEKELAGITLGRLLGDHK